jgi:hypothetical protein
MVYQLAITPFMSEMFQCIAQKNIVISENSALFLLQHQVMQIVHRENNGSVSVEPMAVVVLLI